MVISGEGEYIHNGQIYNISAGDVIITDSHIEHEMGLLESSDSIVSEDLNVLFFNMNIYTTKANNSELYEERLISDFGENHNIVSSRQSQIIFI